LTPCGSEQGVVNRVLHAVAQSTERMAEFVAVRIVVRIAVRIVVEHTVEFEPPFGDSLFALEVCIQRERKFLSVVGTR
jgi:hypothetical protein